jgi:hypothetical protein
MNMQSKEQARSPGAAPAAPGQLRRWLYVASGAAALAAGALFLAAFIEFTIESLLPGTTVGWLSPVGNNWLVMLFKLHAGVSGAQQGQLYVFSLLDISIMAFIAITFLGLYAALMKASKIWSMVALVQPFLGMVIFIVTESAGRSAVMSSVLVISLVMLRDNTFGKATAYTGILASVLLLIGDIGLSIARSGAIAALVGVGYVLLVIWLFMVSQNLLRRGTGHQGINGRTLRQI